MRKAALSLITAAIMMTAGSHALAEIPWQSNLRTAHAKAQAEGKLLLLHFYSDNCTWCERLEAGSFQAPQVGEAVIKDFVPVKIHANTNRKLAEMFKVTKFPTDVIVTTKGTTLSHSVSPQKPDRYVAMLTSAVSVAPPEKPIATPAPATAPAQQVAAIPASTRTTPNYATATAPTYGVTEPQTEVIESPTQAPGGLALPQNGLGNAELTLELPGSPELPKSAGLNVPTGTLSNEAYAPSPPIAVQEQAPVQPRATAQVQAPVQPQVQAADTPELAMQGFCAVTVINHDRWAEGLPEFGVIHLGKLYLFVSEEAMNTFLADPTPYTPVLNEIDVVRFFEEQKIVPGKREWGVKDPIYNRMFFFADEAARDHFEKSYERYTDAAIQVMERAVKEANPGS